MNMTKTVDKQLEEFAAWGYQHWLHVAAADVSLSIIGCLMNLGTWVLWAHILLLQNWAFTYVSRARNSGSLMRHMRAAFLSNGVWWLSQVIIFSKLFNYLSGKGGYAAMILTGIFYTIFTMAGSLAAHAHALASEKGHDAVGANKKLHQVTVEDWEQIQAIIDDFYTPASE